MLREDFRFANKSPEVSTLAGPLPTLRISLPTPAIFSDPINHVVEKSRARVLYFQGYQYTVILILARYAGAHLISIGTVARTD